MRTTEPLRQAEPARCSSADTAARTGFSRWLLLVGACVVVLFGSPSVARANAFSTGALPDPTVGVGRASTKFHGGTRTSTYALSAPANVPPPSNAVPAPSSTTATNEAAPPALPDSRLATPRLLRKSGVPPFLIRREYTTHTTTATAFPPLFFHRKAKPGHPEQFFHADLALTFGWYAAEREKKRVFNPIGLFFYGKSEHKTVWGAPLLLMGYKRVGEQYNFGQFPLFWAWGNRHVKNLLLLPLHFQQKTPDSFSAVSSLLFWYGNSGLGDNDASNDRRHFVAFPLYFRFARGPKRIELSPLYVAGYNRERGRSHRTLLPFFHWQRNEYGNRSELWTVPWVRRTDIARQRSAWAIPPLLTFSSRSADRDLRSVTPLFWQARNHLTDGRTVVAGPYGSYRDPHQHNRWLAPLWWSSFDKDSGTKTNVVLPLFRHRKSPHHRRLDTLPLSWSRGGSGQFSLGVHPLATYVQRDPHGIDRDITLGGLAYWRRRDNTLDTGAKTSWGVGPLVFGRSHADRRFVGVLPALSFFGRDASKHYQVVTPLFWHVRDRAADRRTVVFGPAYFHRDRQGTNAGLPPLVFAGGGPRQRYTIVPALAFGHVARTEQQDALTVSPLFVRYAAPGRRTLGLGWLAWDIRRPDERHSMLFPLYYRRQVGDARLTVTPLGGAFRRDKRSFWLAGPVFGGGNETSRYGGFAPLVLHQTRHAGPNRGSTTLVPPLFARDRRPERDLDVWTPLIWRSHVRTDKPRRGLAVVPFYFRQRQPGGVDVDAGLGWFYSRDRYRRTHTTIIGPMFHRLSREAVHTGVAPFTWWKDSVEQRRLFALPLIFHNEQKQRDEHTTVAVPFWFDRKHANGRRLWLAFPFALGRHSAGYDYLRFSLAPPGYVDSFRLHKNRRITGFFPLLFRYQKCGFVEGDEDACRYTLWGSFPLFAYGRDGLGRQSHSALALYYFDRDPKGMKFYTLLGGAQVRPGERLRWYAGPLYRDTTRTHRTTALFPLFYHRKHRAVDESTTVIVPPLYIGQHRRDTRWWQAGLLFWQFRKQHQVTTVVAPPVFGHLHAYAERRLTWLLPLFYRDNRMGDDAATTFVFPALYMQKRKQASMTAVQFPLVWHFSKPNKRTTIGALVWYDIERRGNRTQVLPALYVRRRTPEKTTTVLGPGLAWWTRQHTDAAADGKAVRTDEPVQRSWRVLLGLFGGGRDEYGRYAAVFGARIPIGEQKDVEPAAAPEPTNAQPATVTPAGAR